MDTPFSLPPDLKAKIEREADARGMSVSNFVRVSLESAVVQEPSGAEKSADDPFFADTAVFRDDCPADLAAKHDDYLYGDAS